MVLLVREVQYKIFTEGKIRGACKSRSPHRLLFSVSFFCFYIPDKGSDVGPDLYPSLSFQFVQGSDHGFAVDAKLVAAGAASRNQHSVVEQSFLDCLA